MPKQSYTAAEAARALGISIDTVRRWDRAGRIEVERDGANRRVIAASEIERLRGGASDELSARNRFRGVVRRPNRISSIRLEAVAFHLCQFAGKALDDAKFVSERALLEHG